MKSLRNRLLTLLALTLFGGAGAWAQAPTTVFEVDFSSTVRVTTGSMRPGNGITSPSSVKINGDVNTIKAIQIGGQYGYSSNWYFSIKPGTGSFKTGDTLLIAVCYNNFTTKIAQADIYAANGTTKLFTTALGINGGTESGNPVVEKFVLEQDADSLLIGGSSSSNDHTYVTTLKVLRPAVIELTKVGANQWSLGQTPDYDLELQVEYYQPHALKEIPAGWTVMVNGVPQTQPYQGDSLMIVETDGVTLVPDNPRRVKSVTLTEPLQTLQIGGDVTGTFYYLPGETWRQAIQNHPTENNTSDEMNGWSVWGDPNKVWKGEAKLYSGGNPVDPDTAISSSLQYQLHW